MALKADNMKGIVFENPVDPKSKKKLPQYKGVAKINGKEYQVACWRGWTKKDKMEYISFSFSEVKKYNG